MKSDSKSTSGWRSLLDAVAKRRLWIGGNNRSARRTVEHRLSGIDLDRPSLGPVDAAIITPAASEEAVYFLNKLRPRLESHAHVWIILESIPEDALPRQAEMHELTEAVGHAGFHLVDPVALDDRWLAIKCTLRGPSP